MSPLHLPEQQDNLLYNIYLQKYNSIKEEIHEQSSKISIILGFLGIIVSILISNIITKSYSFNNIIPVVTEIIGHPPLQEHLIDSLQLVQVQDWMMTILLYVLVFVILTITADFLILFLDIHQKPNMIFPDDNCMYQLNLERTDVKKRLVLLNNIIEAVKEIECNYKYYSAYISHLDRNFVISFLLCVLLLILYAASENLSIFFKNVDNQVHLTFAVVIIYLALCLFIQTVLYIYLHLMPHTIAGRRWIVDNFKMVKRTITGISFGLIFGIYMCIVLSMFVIVIGYWFHLPLLLTFILAPIVLFGGGIGCLIGLIIVLHKKIRKPIKEMEK